MSRGICPQRANRSTGTAEDYTRMLLRGMTLEEIGAQFGVTYSAIRKALRAAGLPTCSRRLLASIPEGCTPSDAEVLRAANFELAQENHALKARLSAIVSAVESAKEFT